MKRIIKFILNLFNKNEFKEVKTYFIVNISRLNKILLSINTEYVLFSIKNKTINIETFNYHKKKSTFQKRILLKGNQEKGTIIFNKKDLKRIIHKILNYENAIFYFIKNTNVCNVCIENKEKCFFIKTKKINFAEI